MQEERTGDVQVRSRCSHTAEQCCPFLLLCLIRNRTEGLWRMTGSSRDPGCALPLWAGCSAQGKASSSGGGCAHAGHIQRAARKPTLPIEGKGLAGHATSSHTAVIPTGTCNNAAFYPFLENGALLLKQQQFCLPTFVLRDDLYKLILLSCIRFQVVL